MKMKRWKAFFDFEKEEKWLNSMAAKGLAMTGYSPLRYTFEECEPGEYIYRMELLENDAKNLESLRYIRFMEENGVEHVEMYGKWVYFRKKAADGAFEIYSDLDSQIKHYQRVSSLWLCLACAEFCISFSQIGGFFHSWEQGTNFWMISVGIGLSILLVAALFFRNYYRNAKKVKRLKGERDIKE